jgi:hypothetical protein
MYYTYNTSGIGPATGVRWQILDAKSDKVIANSPDLSSETPKETDQAFSVPSGTSLVRLRLAYNRELGTPRISGMLVVRSIRIESIPQS